MFSSSVPTIFCFFFPIQKRTGPTSVSGAGASSRRPLENPRAGIGIDISPTACRVMAKRLRDVCGLPESEPLWRAGRGFVVRDLPWTAEKLRILPHFEFENWAVIALGGIPNKV